MSFVTKDLDWGGPHRGLHMTINEKKVWVCLDCNRRWLDKAQAGLDTFCPATSTASARETR